MSAQFTRPLPTPSTVTTVHTSAPIPTPEEAGTTTTYKRAALWVSLVVLLLAVAGIGGTWWWTEYGPGSYLTMPATDGRPLADVEADLGTMGLTFSVEEEFSDDVATGSVTRSDPEGGTPVHKRADVQLYVSKGVDMKTVPDVSGKTQDDAKKALSDAGLALGAITDAYSEDVPQGQVISQSAPSGTSVPHDTAIDVVLSKGREPLTVPSLSGMSADAAKKAIEGLGLVAAPTEAFSDTVAQGQVISQQSAEGSILHRGDTVAYTSLAASVTTPGPRSKQPALPSKRKRFSAASSAPSARAIPPLGQCSRRVASSRSPSSDASPRPTPTHPTKDPRPRSL